MITLNRIKNDLIKIKTIIKKQYKELTRYNISNNKNIKTFLFVLIAQLVRASVL